MDISKLDDNLASFGIDGADIKWINCRDERFSIHGVFYNEEKSLFVRVPDDVLDKAENINLYHLSKMTAGGRLRFVTDSKFIAVKASLPPMRPMPHMSITGSHGFSVYADGIYRNRFSPVFNDFLGLTGSEDDRIIFG